MEISVDPSAATAAADAAALIGLKFLRAPSDQQQH